MKKCIIFAKQPKMHFIFFKSLDLRISIKMIYLWKPRYSLNFHFLKQLKLIVLYLLWFNFSLVFFLFFLITGLNWFKFFKLILFNPLSEKGFS